MWESNSIRKYGNFIFIKYGFGNLRVSEPNGRTNYSSECCHNKENQSTMWSETEILDWENMCCDITCFSCRLHHFFNNDYSLGKSRERHTKVLFTDFTSDFRRGRRYIINYVFYKCNYASGV